MKRFWILAGALILLATIEWVIKGLMLFFIAFYSATVVVWNAWAGLFADLPGGDPYGAAVAAVLVFFAGIWFFRSFQ